jgi:AcrR family transcriptional regulator
MARTLDLEKHTVRKEAFVEVAQRLMQTKGYEEMSIQDLLEELGASRGAFYHYFDSKQALLEAVVDRITDAALATVAPVMDDASVPAAEKLTRVFSEIGRWKTERRALVLSLMEVWMSDENAIFREKVRQRLMTRLVPLLTQIVEQGMAEGVFTSRSPQDTAMVLVMLIEGFQNRALELFIARQANKVTYEDAERYFASYLDAFERILGASPGSIQLIDEPILREWYG